MSRRGWLLFVALSLCWGVPYMFIRIAVRDLDPVLVAFGRTSLGTLLLLPLAIRRRALRPLLPRWRWLLLYTAVEIVGPWVLLGHAETRLNSSTTGLFIAVVPLVAAIILAATGQERFGPRRVVGLLVGFVGAAVLVGLDVRLDDVASIVQLGLVTIGYAIGPIIVARKLADLPPLGVVAASLTVSALCYAPFAPFVEPSRLTATAVGSVVVLAVVCTATAFLVMFALIAEVGPSRMPLITYVAPVIAILLGALVLDEPLTVGLALGFPLVIAGSVLGTWRSTPRRAEATAAASSATVRGARRRTVGPGRSGGDPDP